MLDIMRKYHRQIKAVCLTLIVTAIAEGGSPMFIGWVEHKELD